MASLQSIFNQFDLDNSGFIDCAQLKTVAKKLGESLSDNQIEKLMKGIDSNKDGKISFQEFKEWWIKGHKGKLNDLIILKSKSLKAANQLKQAFHEKGFSFKDYKVTDEKDTGLIRVSFGDNQVQKNPESTGIKLGLMYGSDQLKKFNQTSDKKNQFLDESNISLTIKFPTDQPKKIQRSIRETIKEVLDFLAMNTGIEINETELQTNDYLHLKMQANQKEKYFLLYIQPGNMVKQLIEQMLIPEQELKKNLGNEFEAQFQFQFNLNTSFKSIVEKNQNLVQAFMQGCNLMLHLSVSSSAVKLIKQNAFQFSKDQGPIILTMMRNFDLEFKIRTPEKLEEFFKKLGIWQLVSELPPFKDLIDLITPELQAMNEQSETGQQEQIPLFTPIRKLINNLSACCNSGIQFTLAKPNLVIFAHIQGQGLKLIYDLLFPK